MLAIETTRYVLVDNEEARNFAERLQAFYEFGGTKVRITKNKDLLVVEYDHIIETKETAFGG